MKHPENALALFLLSFLLFLSGCGPSSTVSLLPPPPMTEASLPAPNAPSVCVTRFEDGRLDESSIGEKRDGSAFTTNGDVCAWISRALADELARNGLRVTYAETTDQARTGNPDYLVTGRVEEVWLKELSPMQLSVQMRVNYTLASRSKRIWSETSASGQTMGGLPTGSSADKLLLDNLRDLLKPIARKIIQSIEAK